MSDAPPVYTKPLNLAPGDVGRTSIATLREQSLDGTSDLEILRGDTTSALYSLDQTFDILLADHENILQSLYEKDIDLPSRIQSQAIPILIKNPPENLIAQAQPGSGKSYAFLISSMVRVDPSIQAPQVVILSNTRELAIQTNSVLTDLNSHSGLTHAPAVSGGVEGVAPPNANTQIVIGTSGAVKNLFDNKKGPKLATNNIRFVVVDEADEMLVNDIHLKPIMRLLGLFPQSAQLALFSATFSDQSIDVAKGIKTDWVQIRLKRNEQLVKSLQHYSISCTDDHQANAALLELYRTQSEGQAIIFVSSIQKAKAIVAFLNENKFPATTIHSELTPQERDEAVTKFRNLEIKVFVAINLISRGIDVPQVTLVINYEIPLVKRGKKIIGPDENMYYHRSGRASRFARRGTCVTFIKTPQDAQYLAKIGEDLGIEIKPLEFGQ